MNPAAINFWIVGAAVGYAASDTMQGAMIGLSIVSCLTFIAGFGETGKNDEFF